MAKKKKKPSNAEGAPAWMVTYADMVTLLLTFFVLLLSMARMDEMKFTQAAGSLKDAFGVLRSSDKTNVDSPRVVEFAPISDDLVQRTYQRMLTELQRLRIDEDIELVKDRGAIILRINSAILFEPGSTRVKDEAHPTLRKAAQLIAPLPLHLRIEGHTDDTRSVSGSTSNWDLSVSRAINVLKFFAGEKLLPLDRLSAVGYGDQRPLAPNDSAENRAKNRRVELVLESIGSYREELPFLIDAREQLF